MSKYRMIITKKQRKLLPIKCLVLPIFLLILSIACFSAVLIPLETKENTDLVTGYVSEVQIVDTYSRRGDRVKLKIVMEGISYSLWCPNDGSCLAQKVQESIELSSCGQTELLVSHRPIVSLFSKEKRIVELRHEGETLYSIEQENERIIKNKFLGMLFCALFFMLSMSTLFWQLYVHGTIRVIKKKQP